MDKGLIAHIVNAIRLLGKGVILAENPDKFLSREDVIQLLTNDNIFVIKAGTQISQRIAFELRDTKDYSKILVFISEDNTLCLEDIQSVSAHLEFYLSDYIQGYHFPTIKDRDIAMLETLYREDPIVTLSKKDTLAYIKLIEQGKEDKPKFNLLNFKKEIEELISKPKKDWGQIIQSISLAIQLTIGTKEIKEVLAEVVIINQLFQEELALHYKQTINSSPVKKPKVVSKILDHLSFISQHDKIALVVIDGMAYWQYQMLKSRFPGSFSCSENYTYSWIPSITQLSRQAIFRGDEPERDYAQNPRNEEKLWRKYWKNKGSKDFEIRYNHENIDLKGLDRISKFALVYTGMDEKMHGSTDYSDLKDLTENWIGRSKIINILQDLLNSGFAVYLTTDHGNIQAKGWRGLKGREKLGANKSGSRSQRHIEYSAKWLADDFLASNSELSNSIVQDENVVYFKDEYCFSSNKQLITHGGSHLLEVVIPFIKITNE